MMLATVTILTGVLGVILTNPVDVEHNPWGSNPQCSNYYALTDSIENCRGDIFQVQLFDGNDVITASALMPQIQQPCSPDVLIPYTACIRNVSKSCQPTDRAAILAEGEAYYGRCDDQNTLASWITQYALNDFSHVEPACINYREMCVDDIHRLQIPDVQTPVAKALQMTESNMEVLFACALEHSVNVLQHRRGCTASGLDVFSVVLIELTADARFGIRMYPEQIRKLKELRGL